MLPKSIESINPIYYLVLLKCLILEKLFRIFENTESQCSVEVKWKPATAN